MLSNWCQCFYKYHPNPPVDVLLAATSLLEYHVPHLSQHLQAIGAGADVWAWPLLQSLFSRVLQRADWLMLWDHLLCQEPRFLIIVLISFIKIHGSVLLLARSADEVERALLRPSVVQMRSWLRLTYALSE